MVSFSSLIRSKAKCSDLLSCFLDLNELEVRIFYSLLDGGRATLDEIADLVSRDRSTVFRNLQKLDSLGLISKEMSSLEKGGRISVFVPSDIPTVKEIVTQRIESLKRSMDSFLDEFEVRMNLEMVIYGKPRETPQLKSVKNL
ncbi:MAG: hypothetical protein M1129_06850 [Candidatus Thermoplasmatota archaeon]|nr:hypothetical protein [Candidatus Thermoplasmatota archaeon]MCL5954591.1 hypothetical protein [Candidatus Thermoplasmatota archaeon]